MTPPVSTFGQIALGLGALVVTSAAAGVVGALANPPCTGNENLAGALACGPAWGAAEGVGVGVVASALVGGGVALGSPAYRRAGLTVVTVTTAIAVLGLLAKKASASIT